MSIYKINPARGFESMASRVNQFTNQIADEMEKSKSNGYLTFTIEKNVFNPKIDVQELSNEYVLYVELAGMNKEDVKITVLEDGTLNIYGKKTKNSNEVGKIYLRNERAYGEFNRQFILPENADLSNIAASYNNGVLEITIQKTMPKIPKETIIEIK